MSYLEIRGGVPLKGKLEVQGSKNAVLPVLAACLLGEGVCTIENCPSIGDVDDTLEIMKMLGCRVERTGKTVSIDASRADRTEIGGAEAARIRSSILFLGALLGRMRTAVLPLPGGCAIGKRPIDLHLQGLEQLGAVFSVEEKITARAERLQGARIRLPMASVGATENIILAAVLADGDTVIENAAREPEIDELCEFLNCRGGQITRMSDGAIQICGGSPLTGVRYRMQADRIVTGTYLLAAAAVGGEVEISNDNGIRLEKPLEIMKQMGGKAEWRKEGIILRQNRIPSRISSAETAPYPGFPTDLQSPLMAALCRAEGENRIRETVFENRFRTAFWLQKMGADIRVEGQWATIQGVRKLHPAILQAPDLRGGAALVIAALQTEGTTVIENIEFIERGYEDISRDLRLLGADVRQFE